MYRLAFLVAAAGLAACTQSENDRPATLEYITHAILQPSCGQYVCHSSYRREKNLVFDTVEEARKSLAGIVTPGDVSSSLLNSVLTRTVTRMPIDAPLFDKDIELIQLWIMTGAAEDLGGAQ
jgi:hypothetical protein